MKWAESDQISTQYLAFVLTLLNLRVCYWATSPDDGGSKNLWNIGKLLPDYTAQHPRSQPTSYSPPWEPEISPFSYLAIKINVFSYCRLSRPEYYVTSNLWWQSKQVSHIRYSSNVHISRKCLFARDNMRDLLDWMEWRVRGTLRGGWL
jgi:hypothetical protein